MQRVVLHSSAHIASYRHHSKPRPRHVVRAAQSASRDAVPSALITLPVCPLGLSVFEPHLVALFRDLLTQHPASEQRFVHIVSGPSVPQALLQEVDNRFEGLPRVGCAVRITNVTHSDEHGMTVEYTGERRVQLLHLHPRTEQQPYKVGTVEWLDDKEVEASDPLVASLEQELFAALREVHHLSRELGQPGSELPAAVVQHAPPPPVQGTPLEVVLRAANSPAAHQVAMWRQAGGDVAGSPHGQQADPYVALREGVGRSRRQELFSFAAASVLEPSVVTRIALLITTDTAARLQFVLEVVKPHLKQLRAQASVMRAL